MIIALVLCSISAFSQAKKYPAPTDPKPKTAQDTVAIPLTQFQQQQLGTLLTQKRELEEKLSLLYTIILDANKVKPEQVQGLNIQGTDLIVVRKQN